MSVNAIESSEPTIQVTPLLQSMLARNDQRPKTGLPTETEGTVIENAQLLPEVTLYNAHGILTKRSPNTLVAYA